MITLDEFEVFCRRSFAGVLRTIDDLGDRLVNERPRQIMASSPFALVTHVLGVCDFWIGHILLGRPSDRVRDDEFTASGTVEELHHATDAWLLSLHRSKSQIAETTSLAADPSTEVPLEAEWTVGAVLLHIYEEIAQHLGHLEVTADVLRMENST